STATAVSTEHLAERETEAAGEGPAGAQNPHPPGIVSCAWSARPKRCAFLLQQTGSLCEAKTMLFPSLFRSLRWSSNRNLANRARRAGSAIPQRSFLPQLTVLEDRTVPSTFTVTNLLDSGAGSLRQAVLDANAHAGANVIRFKDGLHGTIKLT